MEVRTQFGERHPAAYRDAVVDYVQVRAPEVDHAVALEIGDIGVSYVPLRRHRPVQDLRSGRHLVYFESDVLADDCEGFADPVAGDAAANRIQALDQAIEVTADIGRNR